MKTLVHLFLMISLVGSYACRKTSNDIMTDEPGAELESTAQESAGSASRESRSNKASAAKAASAARVAAGKFAAADFSGSSGGLDAVLGEIGNIGAAAGSGLMAAEQRTRLVIKSGDLAFEVENYDEASGQINKLVTQWGGFVSSSTTEVPYENVRSGSWTIRIPAGSFETALTELKKLAKKLERESVSGEDVTEEFYDLEARLQNKLLEEKQVREILRRAGTISDVLEVQRELSRIREQIERFEGRKKFMQDRIGLSTVTVKFHEPYPVTISSSGGFWATIGKGFSDGFKGFAKVLSGTITFLIAGLPVFILIGGVVYGLFRLIRRASRNRAARKASQQV